MARTRAALLGLLLCPVIAATAAAAHDYPVTRKADQVDTLHGVRVADPYRWLEDDRSAETAAWVRAQNAVTENFLAALPQREPVRLLVARQLDFERFGIPFKEGGRYFWTRNSGLQPQAVLYTASAPDAVPAVALDPNTLSTDGTVALTGTVPSRDGRLLAYGTSRAGSDWQTWRVRDLASGRDLPDSVEWVKFSSAAWTVDGRGFFYSRYDAPAPDDQLKGRNEFQKVYFHALGTPQSADRLVMRSPDDAKMGFSSRVTDDGRWLVVTASKDTGSRTGLLVLPLPGGRYEGGTPRPLAMALDAQLVVVGSDGDTLFVRSNRGAPNGRLVALDLNDAQAPWRTLVDETGDALVGASAVGGRFVLRYLRDASTLVRVHAADGRALRELPLPGIGTASGFEGRWNDPETFFSFTSLTTPADVWRIDLARGGPVLFKRPKTAFDPTQFETRREFVTSRDGTRFPVFIAQRKGLPRDGRAPTLLYGYGGFNLSQTPSFSVTAATWMEMGGTYVLASVRGGGEYGRAWHEAGTKLKKQNVFDDFIAAAEWLVAQKITQPSRLAVMGGSNGGLLVGAVVNQRPELFGAALPAVGVMDMLRYHRFTIGWAWAGDYGTADDPEQFKALRAYSPLHNIRAGAKYPPILVTTADHDDRVVPAHSFKYAAQLQATDTGPAPKLIRIDTDAGHGAGKPTAKVVAERGDMLAFVAHALGLRVDARAAD